VDDSRGAQRNHRSEQSNHLRGDGEVVRVIVSADAPSEMRFRGFKDGEPDYGTAISSRL
jgi:hypothetical protein